MKIKTLPAAFTLLGALCFGEGQAALANHVFFDPSSLDVNLGDTFSLVLKGEAFSGGLDGGSVDLSFDSTILQADSVVVNATLWSFINQPGTIDNSAGKIEFTDFSQFGANLSSGSFDIATFTFVAVGSGSSAINLSVNNQDPFGSAGNVITPDFSNALINVSGISNVPLPASAWLMFSAMAGFITLKRQRK